MLLRLFTTATALFLLLLGAKRRRLRDGSVDLVYYRIGPEEGEPWLLLHGLGSVAVTWSPVMRALGRHGPVVVPELSTVGGSEVPGGSLGVAAGARIAATLIEKELPGRAVTVAGLSLGGWMATRLALARPELVSRLVLIDAAGYRRQNWNRIQRLVTIDDLAGVDRFYRAVFVHPPWQMRLSRAAFLRIYSSAAVRGALAATTEADTFDDADLRRLAMPTAVIWGEEDRLFAPRVARKIAAALPDAHLQILAGCSHALHVEHPDRLVAAIEAFRREVPVDRV
ncbi:MAG TPA: alpha/beta hydrolase [Thermoanaerobaculia bacterium]